MKADLNVHLQSSEVDSLLHRHWQQSTGHHLLVLGEEFSKVRVKVSYLAGIKYKLLHGGTCLYLHIELTQNYYNFRQE